MCLSIPEILKITLEEVATQVDEKEVAIPVDEKMMEEVATRVGETVKEVAQTAEEMQGDEGESTDKNNKDEGESEYMHVYFPNCM